MFFEQIKSLVIIFIKPSCDTNFAGEDCTGVEDKKTCKRNKAIEEALETVRADYAKDRQVCRSSLDRNHVLCVKARLKTEIAAYILQHPNIIGDFEGLKREIKNEFSAVKAGVLNKLLNALAAEIKKGDGSEGIDAGKLADLVISVATHISGDKA